MNTRRSFLKGLLGAIGAGMATVSGWNAIERLLAPPPIDKGFPPLAANRIRTADDGFPGLPHDAICDCERLTPDALWAVVEKDGEKVLVIHGYKITNKSLDGPLLIQAPPGIDRIIASDCMFHDHFLGMQVTGLGADKSVLQDCVFVRPKSPNVDAIQFTGDNERTRSHRP